MIIEQTNPIVDFASLHPVFILGIARSGTTLLQSLLDGHPQLLVDVALRFAFDAHPRTCFEKNGQHLPFGAHAWNKWDRSFWEPHLLK